MANRVENIHLYDAGYMPFAIQIHSEDFRNHKITKNCKKSQKIVKNLEKNQKI